ncbi:MAG: elongation factor Ts, partial [Lachnospiraceae bacterium]|nr:elongation factor Ts [Lachnospiraceae bacterium]
LNGVWSDADKAISEEKKSNMNYLPNFLSDAAKAQLAELALADKATISGDKIFAGLVEGRISKHLKEICLLDQVYVKAEDGKQSVAAYLKSVDANINIAKFVRFEVGEGMEKKQENFAEEVAKQMNA